VGDEAIPVALQRAAGTAGRDARRMAGVVRQDWRRAGRSRLADENGFVVHHDGSTSDDAAGLRGYGVIQAEGRGEALDLVRDHPLLAVGSEYTIEIFEVPRK
jgi:hypothetical protein